MNPIWFGVLVLFTKLLVAKCEATIGCEAWCTGNNCTSGLSQTTSKCVSTCVENSCSAVCRGSNCTSKCQGIRCMAGCNGHDCSAECTGVQCEVWCQGEGCVQQSFLW